MEGCAYSWSATTESKENDSRETGGSSTCCWPYSKKRRKYVNVASLGLTLEAAFILCDVLRINPIGCRQKSCTRCIVLVLGFKASRDLTKEGY